MLVPFDAAPTALRRVQPDLRQRRIELGDGDRPTSRLRIEGPTGTRHEEPTPMSATAG